VYVVLTDIASQGYPVRYLSPASFKINQVPKLNQDQNINLNSHISPKEIETVINSLLTKKQKQNKTKTKKKKLKQNKTKQKQDKMGLVQF
jgi:predicted transcriptional regulator